MTAGLSATAEDDYKSGIFALSMADDARAIRDFERALNKNPSDLRARVPLAFAYFRGGKYHEAESVLAEQLKRSKDDIEALILLVHVRFARGTENLALTAYHDYNRVFTKMLDAEVRKSVRPGMRHLQTKTAEAVKRLAQKRRNLGLPRYIHGLLLKKTGISPTPGPHSFQRSNGGIPPSMSTSG